MRINSHYEYWPKRLPKILDAPKTSLYDNLDVSARRYPDKIAIHYYGGSITYQRLCDEVKALAGFLQSKLGVNKNDRVLLFMQNSPQFVIAYYAILRANAVVVPMSPMNVTNELEFYINDCKANVALVGKNYMSALPRCRRAHS